MVIGLAKAVLCFTICLNLTRAYQQQRTSFGRNDLYPRYQVTSRPLPTENKIRHSRYPKFGEVMTRIENFSKGSHVESSSKSVYNKKTRHKNWNVFYKMPTTTTTTTTPEPLFDELTYGDYEDEDDDRSDYDDEDYDDDDMDDEEYDLFETVEDDMQAEEPTERSTTVSAKAMSSFSEYKWNKYGTRAKVEESRQQYVRNSPEQASVDALFMDHYIRASKQTKCHQPLPRVITVKKEHPHLTKTYTPSCTVLHRCSEETGCCNRNTKCQYKSRVLVQLYFYARELGGSKVEKLEFYNHTECECRDTAASDDLPVDTVPDLTFKPSRQFSNPQTVKRCTCPALFEDARYSNRCACDCAHGNEDCLRLKRGMEHFNLIERICIQEGRCGIPLCEHGVYVMNSGKCPTKKEKLDEYRRVELNFG